MSINLTTKKKFIEASYLSADNAYRYRTILRIAFNQYEKMKFWLYKEEIYEEIKKIDDFKEYNINNLKQDLDSLEEWGNFITIQDTGRVQSVEEFKNRKYRYQISPNTIELERTLMKLEKASGVSRGSLEVSLIERFKNSLMEIRDLDDIEESKIYSCWGNLNRDFKTLNENYQDYISSFYSPKSEQMLKTTEFLLFKENFIRYLRNFVKGLQIHVPEIREIFSSINEEKINSLIHKVVSYEKKTHSLNNEYNIQKEAEINAGRYYNIKEWFLGSVENQSMIDNLLDNTNEIIRKITSYALQIIEMENSGGSRKEDYKTLIKIFENCRDIEEAHKLSSVVFGVMSPRHIIFTKERETESINSSIFDEASEIVTVKPSNRYREKTASRIPIKDKSKEKREKAQQVLKEREKERKILEGRIENNRIIFKNLNGISREERRVFLRWLSLGLNKKGTEKYVKNEFGRYFTVEKDDSKEDICIKCEDGDFFMPPYEILFK